MLRTSLRLSVIYALEAVAVLLALAIFAVGALLVRLSNGPIELDFLRADAQRMLAQAFEGELVALGALEARFDPETHALVIQARDVTVAESHGEVIARAPRLEAGFAVESLLLGRIEPVTVSLSGGSISIVRRADGAVGVGLGSVDRVSATARLPARGGDDSASLFQLLQHPTGSDGMLGKLRHVDIENASVRIVDDLTGIAWLVDEASVRLDRDDTRILAELAGQLATPSGFAPMEVRIQAGAALNTLLLEARVAELSPAAVAPVIGPLSVLRVLDAPISLDLLLNATREAGIRGASINLDIGAGHVLRNGETTAFNSGTMRLNFDPDAGELTLSEARVDSEVFTAELSGRMFELSDYVGALPMRWRYQMNAGAGRIDLGGIFERPPVWNALELTGVVDLNEARIELEQLDVDLGPIQARLAGETSLSEVADGRWLPNLRLSGPIEGDVQPETVLAYWPVLLADSARVWIRESILGGRYFNARLDLDLDAESVAAGALADDRLTLGFDFEDAVVRYVPEMRVLDHGSGHAVLRGNAFEVAMTSGRIGDIELSQGVVDIPRLNPKGALARFAGVARGSAGDILALIDEPPLFLTSSFGVSSDNVDGRATVEFEFRRPMLDDVDPDDIPFTIDGTIENASATVPGTGWAFTEGQVELHADPAGLTARSDGVVLDTPIHFVWHENFQAEPGDLATAFELTADVGPRTFDQLGIPARLYLDGAIHLQARAAGAGMGVSEIRVDADLLDASLDAPGGVWAKPAGEPGQAGFTLRLGETGSFYLEDFRAQATGLSIAATAEFSSSGRLVRADIGQLQLEELVDLTGSLTGPQEAGGAFGARFAGRYLDIRELRPHLRDLGSGGGEMMPLSASLDVGRLIVSDRSQLDDFSLIWRSEAAGIRAFSIAGTATDGPFQASFGAEEDGGARELRLEAQSAGRLAALLGGEGYARGGQVSVLGEAPPLGTEGPLTARVEIRDLTLVQVPILARILAAGSFEGLSALLNGEGIEFDAIDASVMFEDGLLTIGEARARGSALGVTASGTVDFTNQRAAIDGNLAPSYVLNSFLGDLPVIGDMLVSRPGEGIIGIVYSVEGPFDSLTVFANPLSALAPGFLRRIFEGSAADRAARDRAESRDEPATITIPEILPEEVLRDLPAPAGEAEPPAVTETDPAAAALPPPD
ncbi:AsmA-like C-terminal region-containing protein [Maricaulis sp.]|uniref:YhdP family protein n=1 Tax=Maricaulis sp. TaxID=1486257 RepID=UPI003A921FBD